MNSSADDIKDLLVAESSLGLVFATNLFVGFEPAKPQNCVTVFDTFGFSPSLALGDLVYEYPSIQIRVCNIDYRDGWDLSHDIKTLLHGLVSQTINGTLYTVIYCTSGPALLDRDENGRFRFIINFNLQRR